MKKIIFFLCAALLVFTACRKKDVPQRKATVATTVASNITDQSATTGGSITDDGGSPITQRGVVWATHTEPSLTDSIVTDGSSAATWVSNLTNLKPNTTYYVRAYATNAQGTAYGNEISFKTAAGLATVTTAAITENVALSAKSGGEVVNDGGTPVTARGIVYATTPNPTTTNLKIEAGTGPGAFTITIPTASEITYYVRAFATNSTGTAYGEEISFKATSSNSVGDIDGNVYGIVVIGTQTWTTSNLKVTRYRNGDPITDGSGESFSFHQARPSVAGGTNTGAFTYANRDIANNEIYGKLYNISAVRDNRSLCPGGWHVPSDEEWKILEVFLGMSQEEADARRWRGTISPLLVEGGTSGLNLKLGGYLLESTINYGTFYYVGEAGYFLTSTDTGAEFGEVTGAQCSRGVHIPGGSVGAVTRNYDSGRVGSLRCVKD